MASFAYLHCTPSGTPFYVGKGALRRVKYLGGRNAKHQEIVDRYGKDNILVGLLECSTSDVALELEIGIIKCLKRSGVELCNLTSGGGGTQNPDAETRQKLSVAAKKRGVSEDCRAASAAAKKGKPLSDEQKKKQSASMKGIVFSDAHRANISLSAKKRGMPNAVIVAAQKTNKGTFKTNEARNKHSKAMILHWDKKGRKEKVAKTTLGNCWDSRATRSIIVDGVLFKTMKAAAQEIGTHSAAIIYALKHTCVVKGRTVAEVQNGS
jgi:hypothetical protein